MYYNNNDNNYNRKCNIIVVPIYTFKTECHGCLRIELFSTDLNESVLRFS